MYEAAKGADGNRKRVTYGTGGSVRFRLSAGRYYVTATYGSAVSGVDIDATAGVPSIQRTLDLRAGVLRLSSVLAAGGKPLASDVRYNVYKAAKGADGNRKRVTYDSGG